eukprot:36075_1
MKKKKRTSKKTNFSTKKLIKKKKHAFHNKAKKHAKQMIALGIKPRSRHKKTQLSVPNLCPFKKDLIKKALRRRQELKAELEQKKLEKKERKQDVRKAIANCKKDQERGLAVPKSLQSTSWGPSDLKLPRSNWEHKHLYYKELNKVIANSDVIIEVLDARDPDGCRSKVIEKKVISGKSNTFSGKKKLILLLNKIDLIPSEILSKWMKVLKREYPVIAFKASTQSNKRKLHSNLKFNKVTTDKQRNHSTTNRCVGGNVLIELLKKYSLSLNITTPITVGFIGYPNTGKSSIINSLKRQQSVGTSSTAGFTTTLKEVKLDKMIKLIDSPGVILNDNEIETRLVLRNALKLQDIDPIEAVAHILTVANHRSLAQIYDINMGKKRSFGNYEEFLSALAFKVNHLKSGGVPDLYRAAALMIHDWNHGKIPFYVTPPEIVENNMEIKFVDGGFSKEFDVDQLLDANHKEAMEVTSNKTKKNLSSYLALNANKFVVGDEEEKEDEMLSDQEEDDEDMDVDEDDNLIDEEIMKTHAFMTA